MTSLNSEFTLLSLEIVLERVSTLTLRIQQGQDLEDIVQWALDDTRMLLQTDRLLIYRFLGEEESVIVFESVSPEWLSFRGQLISEPWFKATWLEHCQQGKTTIISDIRDGTIAPCSAELLEQLQVRAHVVIPILSRSKLWGLLIVHHCRSPREWHPLEVQYLQQIALQFSVAIQQADLRQFNPHLLTAKEQVRELGELTEQQQASLALQEREYYYAQVLNAVQDMVFCKAPGSMVVYANQAACDYYQMTLEQLRGITDVPFNQLDFTQQYLQDDLHVFTTGEVIDRLEEPNQAPNGEVHYFHTVKSPIFDAEGQVIQIVGVSRDVTAHKQAKEQLQTLSDRLNLAVEAAKMGIWDWDMVTHRVSGNDRLYELYGISRCEWNETYEAWQACIHPEDLPHYQAATEQAIAGESVYPIEFRIILPDGTLRHLEFHALIVRTTEGEAIRQIGIYLDISERKAAEVALREQQQFTEQLAESTLAMLYVYDLVQQRTLYCNSQIETVLGYSPQEMLALDDICFARLIHPEDLPKVIENHQTLLHLQDQEFVELEYRMRHKTGEYRWLLERSKLLNRTPEGNPKQRVGVAIDITVLKETQITLRQQTEREHLLMAIAQDIRQTLDLEQILHTAVTGVRQFLQVDRVVIYRFEPDWNCTIVAESVTTAQLSLLGLHITAAYFEGAQAQSSLQGEVTAIDDIDTATLEAAQVELMEQLQVRAKLVVPILQQNSLWGLLVAHHCQAPRHWEPFEIQLQQQLATQIAIAIQQSELYQQVQTLNASLELQVQERTAQLEQALQFEELLKRITDKVRDSLDEQQILQTVIEELASGLQVEACDTGMYNAEQTTSTVAYEFTRTLSPTQGQTLEIVASPYTGVYSSLLQGQVCYFCDVLLNSLHTQEQLLTVLACPIQDERGVLGDIWLFKSCQQEFNELESRLVQQVANQCAIALRQSRLYQAAQAQVQELERLNQLKDDFLSTVSHELRSPMSNIKMATQMLEITLNHLGILADESNLVHRYFKVLREEGQREITLINDLLDLTRLDAGTEPLQVIDINLQDYIPELSRTFVERMQQQQQQFVLQIPHSLPPLMTDLPYFERILAELLHNACKYTPAGETITVSAQGTPKSLEIRVSNTGVEIAPVELDRIFDKFYRIPNNDPWKYGGTGLGLALVKKLTERLGGTIRVESTSGQTTFILEFDSTACAKSNSRIAYHQIESNSPNNIYE
ncbi:MAG TPA: GAF domain-containing protein [Allocoleopsis sp.]